MMPKPLPITVIILAKAPAVGRVKTRLEPIFGAEGANAIHLAMLRCILERAARWVEADQHRHGALVLDPGDQPFDPIRDRWGPTGWRCAPQSPGDLGQRIHHAWATHAATTAGRAIVLGSDSPDVPLDHLDRAEAALDDHDLAVGPVEDGGYWTLATRTDPLPVLEGIDWGSDRVYHQTNIRARSAGLSIAALQPWHDVDEPDDLRDLFARTDADDPALRELKQALHPWMERLPEPPP